MALAGGALTLAFPEPDLAPLAWIAIAPLLASLAGVGARRGALLGMAFGLCFFGTLLYWISIVGFVAWFVLVVLQASYVALFGAVWGAASRRTGRVAAVVLPALLWVGIVEYLRSITPVVGFTWGQLAQSQHDLPAILKTASWGGSWAVALLLLLVNALVARGVAHAAARDPKAASLRFAAAAAVLLLGVPWPSSRATGPITDVAIVQGNIPETRPASYEKDLVILTNHVRLTQEEIGALENEARLRNAGPIDADLVVWPESSVGVDPGRDPFVASQLRVAAQSAGQPLIVGGNRAPPDADYHVMAYLVSPEGDIVDEYQKTHLVPFGEYVPGRRFLDWIPALEQVPLDAVAGDDPVVFEVPGGGVAPVISFEADFGSLVRERVAGGGRLLVVLTNTSTWRHSWASAQHVAMSQVRAAETGVYVAHAALTGISAFIDPAGRVVERSELWEPDVLLRRVRFADQVTLYARAGDWLAIAALLVSAGCLPALRLRRAR